MVAMGSTGGLAERRVRLAHGDEVDPAWNERRPELAFAVNAVSLLMPYAEPYFVHAVRGEREVVVRGEEGRAALELALRVADAVRTTPLAATTH